VNGKADTPTPPSPLWGGVRGTPSANGQNQSATLPRSDTSPPAIPPPRTPPHKGEGDIRAAPFPRAAAPFHAFARLLRHFGFRVAPEQATSFIEAVGLLGPRSMDDIREAALATLATPPDRRAEFDALFRSHFYGDASVSVDARSDEEDVRVSDDDGVDLARQAPARQEEGGALSTAREQLGARSFDRDGPRLKAFQRALPSSLPTRRSFRTVRTASRGTFDLRRSLREIVRADGDIPEPLLRRRQAVPRPLLMLIDISGSMKVHTADYLKVAHAAVQAAARAEVLTFGTRLTRITSALRIRDPDRALARAAALVEDWDGGTRIGATLLAFLSVPRFSAFARGAAVVILSDALERGDHSEMEIAMRRLGSRAFRLSLCTPLAGDPRFRPETAALKAILPALDDLVDGSSVAALTRFILTLARPAPAAEAVWRKAS
jgi:uncharacterized protein with von Willebrand factor type A (vWA) domain